VANARPPSAGAYSGIENPDPFSIHIRIFPENIQFDTPRRQRLPCKVASHSGANIVAHDLGKVRRRCLQQEVIVGIHAMPQSRGNRTNWRLGCGWICVAYRFQVRLDTVNTIPEMSNSHSTMVLNCWSFTRPYMRVPR